MLYAIISQDVEHSLEKRKSVRPAHIERLNRLKDEGRLILNKNKLSFSSQIKV
jgi:uncharacterized protein YciI